MANLSKGDKVVVTQKWKPGDHCYQLTGMTGEVLRDPQGEDVWVTLDDPRKWFGHDTWAVGLTDVCMNPAWLSIQDTIQTDTYNYLVAGGSVTERRLAMDDLVLLNFFHTGSAEEARGILENYLAANSRRFCEQGIKRLRTALKLPEPLPKKSPLHAEAINVADLKMGDMFRRYHEGIGNEVYIYLGEYRDQPVSGIGRTEGQIKVFRVNRSVGAYNPGEQWIFTGDAGLTPYNPSGWNRSNHCRREVIEPQKVVSSSRRRSATGL